MHVTTDTEAVSTVESIANAEANSQPPVSQSARLRPTRLVAILGFALLSVAALCALAIFVIRFKALSAGRQAETTVIAERDLSTADESNLVRVDEQQMPSITLEPVTNQQFVAEKIATGKIGFNEDVMTPVFSPYTGRVLRLLAKPGDAVRLGTPLFEIDTPDLVQVEQEFIAASIAVPKAKSALDMATRAEDRQHRLYLNKAVALKDWEQAEADVRNAERDLHSAANALSGARSRLSVFGKTNEEIAKIENDRQLDRITRVLSPIAGTTVARKVGPGQFVKPDSTEPLFTIADLSTVWLLADVSEADVPLIKVGQRIEIHVAAYPNETFTARIAYVSPSVDPATHRAGLRSIVENRGRRLKPEMFASFRVVTNAGTQSLAVPTTAIVREGDKTSVWVAQGRNHFARRDVTTGIQQGGYVQIVSGLQLGETVVSEGSIFVGNAAKS